MSMHISAALFCHADPARLIESVAADLAKQDLDFTQDADRLECDTGIGRLSLYRRGDAVRIEVQSDSQSNLHTLCEGVTARLDRLRGEAVALDWFGAERRTKGLPPNVRIARIVSQTRVGRRFVRLRLAADDLADFALSGLHIRLIIPDDERVPVWPFLNAKGRTVWPGVEDGMHMPAYTIRAIDPAKGWLDVDVFVHGQGRTCRWAEVVEIGSAVGISGPGGGWMPPGRRWLLAGDETALPAIARILEAAPIDVTGETLIEVETRQDTLPLKTPDGITVRWLFRNLGEDLVREVKAAELPRAPGGHVWFAAEKARAAEVRAWLRGPAGLARQEVHAAGYWSRPKNLTL